MLAPGIRSTRCGFVAALLLGALLAGCASGLKPGSDAARASAPGARTGAERDGPGTHPPADLDRLPDAEPRVEPIRSSGANKPYQVFGRDYTPFTRDLAFSERGLASWYGRQFHGKRTASGEPYDMYAMTAAHPTLPIPSYARIRNPANGREVIVRVNDRGPFHAGRIVDLSYAAALRLDLLHGVAPVELERVTFDEIRAGTWRRDAGDGTRFASRSSRTPVSEAVVVARASAGSMAAPPLESVAAGSAEIAAAPTLAAGPMTAGDAAAPGAAPNVTAPLTIAAAPAGPPPAAADGVPRRGFFVQLGAFRDAGGAESFQRRVADDVQWLLPILATFADAALYRVQAGPYASRDEAQGAAAKIREALGLVPMIVERR